MTGRIAASPGCFGQVVSRRWPWGSKLSCSRDRAGFVGECHDRAQVILVRVAGLFGHALLLDDAGVDRDRRAGAEVVDLVVGGVAVGAEVQLVERAGVSRGQVMRLRGCASMSGAREIIYCPQLSCRTWW
jgi:hypothetical protein